MDASHPLDGVMDLWEDVIDDMEATAEEYREKGWETYELHPGDVVPLPHNEAQTSESSDTRVGLDVVVPGDEFAAIEPLVEDGQFNSYEAFRAEAGGVVFLVIAMQDEEAKRAVLIPCYYRIDSAREMLMRAERRNEMRTWVRPLDQTKQVVFGQNAPQALLPAGGSPDDDGDGDVEGDIDGDGDDADNE